MVTDNNQNEMRVCSTCSNPNNKAKGMMILIRNVVRVGTQMTIFIKMTY